MQITFYSYSLFCLKSSVDLLWKIYRCRKNTQSGLALATRHVALSQETE